MKSIIFLFILLALTQFTAAANTKAQRRCKACQQLGTAIEAGLKRTKHKEGMVEEHGRIDSSGKYSKTAKKVPYSTSEARLVEIIGDACKTNDNKAECYELVEEDEFYSPLKSWFTGGRKGEFFAAFCQKTIPGCAKEDSAPAAASKQDSSKKAKVATWEERMFDMIPEKIREKPFVKNLLPQVKVSKVYAIKYAEVAQKYTKIAYKYTLVVSKHAKVCLKKANKILNVYLDKLPVRKYIAKLPLNEKQSSFVEKNWKLIVLTLFIALITPMYYVSGKCCKKSSRQAQPARPNSSNSMKAFKTSKKSK